MNKERQLASEFRRLFLEELRTRGFTFADVARAYGCSDENIAQLLARGRDLKLSSIDALCKAIGRRPTIRIE